MRSEYDFGRRRLRSIVFTIAAIVLILYVANLLAHHHSLGRNGSVAVSASKPFRIGKVPTTYYARFDVDTRAGGTRVVNVERTWVQRPFDSRIETWQGKKQLSVRQSNFGALANFNPSAAPLSISVPPNLAGGDLRVDTVLHEALKRHVIEQRERRRVYGRECQVYRAGGPVSAGDLTTYKKGSTEYADFCVDRTGLVIEEWWISKGTLLRRRVARTVRTNQHMRASLFHVSQPKQETIDRGSIQKVPEEVAATQKLWSLPRTPKGFVHLGRYFVVLPSGASGSPQTAPQTPTSSLTDVWRDGPNIVVVDQGGAGLEASAAAENRTSISVHVKGLTNAVLVLDARATEVRGETPDGSFVRVFGTLSPSQLIALAGELRSSEG